MADSQSANEIQLTEAQRITFSQCLQTAGECSEENKKLRDGTCTAETIYTEQFNQLWSKYSDLLTTLMTLINESRGTQANLLFTKSYEVSLAEYFALKEDFSIISKQAQVKRTLLVPQENKEQIFSDLLHEIKIYEEKNLHLISDRSQQSNKNSKTFFLGLLKRLKAALQFIRSIFYTTEASSVADSLSFYLTPLVKISWLALMQVENDSNKDELLSMANIDSQAESLIFSLSELSTKIKNQRAAGHDSASDNLQAQNLFSGFCKNLAESMISKDSNQYYGRITDRIGRVLAQEEEKTDFFGSISMAIKGDEVKYEPLNRNSTLKVIFSTIEKMYQGIEILETLIDPLAANFYEITLYVNFVKRFGLKMFLAFAFHRLDRFNEQRKKGFIG